MSAETPSLRAVRLMRLVDRRKGALVGVEAEGASSQRLLIILQGLMQNAAIPLPVRDMIRQQVDAALNDGAEPFLDLTLKEMEGFLSGMRFLHLNVDAEYAELSKIREGMEHMAQRNRADDARRNANPLSVQDSISAFDRELREDGEFNKRCQRLWARIDVRIKDVLTIMAQMAPPNAKELVEAFTGEP